MKASLFTLGAFVSTGLAAELALPQGWFTFQPTEKIKHTQFKGKPRYLSWMADSQIQHGVEPTLAYTVSAFYSGILLAYERTRDRKYFDYVKRGADILLYPEHDGTVLMYNNSNSIDDIRIGHTFLDIYNVTGEEIYKKAATSMRKQIDRTGRTPNGGFYHRFPAYIDQMWLDGFYMLDDKTTKGWWLVMDPGLEGKSGNYIESSGTAMFVNGLFKAMRKGYIHGDKYLQSALTGYKLMTSKFAQPHPHDGALAWEWTVQTGSLSSNGTFEYYASMPLFENDLKGVAPFLFSSYEYELYQERA
ncbi:glycosyl hydrolase [Fusarium acuminatum]|uniref:Glycosyl hydrolase n=1 Tax=Fusarium acuminatum TaxID=5515 RepID=A0ABZ2X1B7_9HYPO